MGREAGAGDRHAEAEGEPAEDERPGERADEGVGRQASGAGVGHPGSEDQRIAHGACGQRREKAEDAVRLALLQPFAQGAVEAEARPLQHEAEGRAEDERQGARLAARARQVSAAPTSAAARSKAGSTRRALPAQAPTPSMDDTVVIDPPASCRPGTVAPPPAAAPHLPVQTVLDTLTIGEPTELPYSVQEPS